MPNEGRTSHLTQEERSKLRDQIAMRALPFCCVEAEKAMPQESRLVKAKLAAEHAYIVADAVLAARTAV